MRRQIRTWDAIARGYLPPRPMLRRIIAGVFFLAAFFITRARTSSARRHELRPAERAYVRPPRRFEIPVYHPDMRHCNSHEKYLRPTLYCNSQAPEVIALAHHLGAYRLSDRGYAEAAFEFVKRNITFELLPLGEVEETIWRGTGACLHRLALLVALLRTAGIRTRYTLYTLTSLDTISHTLGRDAGTKWSTGTGRLLYHGQAESYIGDAWVVASIGLTPERQASLGCPITRFGEVTLGTWYIPDPRSVVTVESIPYGLNPLMRFVCRVAPAAIDRVNASIVEQCNRGRAILDELGEEAYDAQARMSLQAAQPQAVLKQRNEIVFGR